MKICETKKATQGKQPSLTPRKLYKMNNNLYPKSKWIFNILTHLLNTKLE